MKKIINYIEIFCIILFFAFMFKVLSCSISKNVIQKNLNDTENVIALAGIYPRDVMRGAEGDWKSYGWSMIDYFTEWILVNGVANVDPSEPFKSAMANYRYSNGNWNDTEHVIKSINENIEDEQLEMVPQYWWGSLALIRVLMIWFSYDEILILFNICFYVLLAIVLYKIANQVGKITAFSFIISLGIINFTILPYMFEFGMVFVIMLISILLILKYINCTEKEIGCIMIFSGMLTNYFDWMSTPLVACVVPLEIYTIYQLKTRRINKLIDCIKILNYGIIWCIAYVGMLLMKWILSILMLGSSVCATIITRLREDTSTVGNRLIYYIETISRNINMLGFGKVNSEIIMGLIVTVWIASILCMILRKQRLKQVLPLFIYMCIPMIWAFAFSWHTHEHFWFTYRNFIAMIFPTIAILFDMLNSVQFYFKPKAILQKGDNINEKL